MNSPNYYRPSKYSFPSLESIISAERVLTGVLGSHVYVGGSCVGFYVDDPGAEPLRPTDDVDVVIEIKSHVARVNLDEALRAAGLEHDFDGPICRWSLGRITLDIMPADSAILGFTNRWYQAALASAVAIALDDLTVMIPDVCTFIGTKVEAFNDRGNGDFIASSDFEDIVRVLDGCSFLPVEWQRAEQHVRDFVGATLRGWVGSRGFEDAVAAHLLDIGDIERRFEIFKRIEALTSMKGPR